ncbi:hypothetical protein BOX37_12950 [Nocardia mangyaensis]|uniref:Uncharacterized protein n=1 Tax=Nocardia mangyaensis TaxID=2213200 RepID=A0A1J0VRQ3_9NOCA|nr:hypothetical protein BOX37_12950 [Nocardia mangyaensis]
MYGSGLPVRREFAILIPDNLQPVVSDADPLRPRFIADWLDYTVQAGFITDPARMRSPKDKPPATRCSITADTRIHGTTWAHSVEDAAAKSYPCSFPCQLSTPTRS